MNRESQSSIPWILVSALLLVSVAGNTHGEERVRFQGLLDVEVWKTSGESRYLSRNEDETAGSGRLRLWTIGEFNRSLQGFLLTGSEGGDAVQHEEPEASGTETEIEQAFLRFSPPGRPLTLEAGKLATPIGNFSRRYFSSQNPLIGSPAGYGIGYPIGIQLTGAAGRFDYRVAVIDTPMVNEDWVPEADPALRPALAAGLNPIAGTRLGVFATRGPYLGEEVEDDIPAGERWRDFDQIVYGVDLHFSRGYFELNAEWTRSVYEVPRTSRNARGVAYFVEPKYTFTPRFFAALRVERNDYPYVQPVAPGVWISSNADFTDAEIGAGYRFARGLLLKVGYRLDRWNVRKELEPIFPDGSSVSAQLSYAFDINSWFRKPL